MRHDVAELDSVSMTTLPSLDDAADARVCGHKAATLAVLKKAGFAIPDGFVVPAGRTSSSDEIAAALARLGDGPVAVRSSGLAEDLADASFAGQYDTVLNVRGTAAVVDAVAACVASAGNARVSSYGHGTGAMAVLVQKMIAADAAGVAFSANPLTGNRAEVLINATRGLGDRLVSGEINGDEWLVAANHATAVVQPQRAIEAETALRIATLARKVETARLAPQDIEWAISGDQIWLLQARPITALPVAPAIETPKGTWQKDAGHFPDPISPFAATTQFRHGDRILDAGIAKWGLLPDKATFKIIGHEPYIHIDPDDGGKQPPPWWVLGVLARVIPPLRRKLKASARAIDAGLLESSMSQWTSDHKPKLQRQIADFAARDLTALDTDALFRHIDTLSTFYADCLSLHFDLAIPYAVGVYELAIACEQLLGWDVGKTAGLLQGLSTTSVEATDALASIVRRSRPGSAARQLLESRDPDVLTKLEQVDPLLASDLRRYLRTWDLRPLGSEVGMPLVSEQPQLLANTIADVLVDHASADAASARNALRDEARQRLDGDNLRRFDTALAYAERVYSLREDNVVLTDQMPVGLLRLAALEAGRRLVALGLLSRREDAVMLTAGELHDALRNSSDVRAAVARHKAEHAWVRANPGPMTYGPPPGKSPDLRGLPEPSRRVNAALMWMLEGELTPPPASDGDAITGIGASAGVYRGRVRVIKTPDKLHTLQAGEVLVCPLTSSAWMMVFRRAGAIVADSGSVLSHTAIVAREFGLPAVVAASTATARLSDGDEVIVDGTRGTVTRC